jgi:FAD/FMN-containing dehydrogenase
MAGDVAGDTAGIEQEAADRLQSQIGGKVSLPGTAGYDEAINIWNGAITRHPGVVASCTSASDVSAAVLFAQREGLEISVRGGGHNYGGSALTEGGLMIDLTPMKAIAVDAGTKRATCGGGATWAELDAATQEHGLAVPGGFVSHTGVGGLTLGGGLGWLGRLAGLSSDNVVGAEVVVADGSIRRASASENPDLLWAIRGGGGNFGVVTEFEFALHDVGPIVHLALFLFRPDDGRDLFRFARDFVRDAPDNSGVFLAGLSAPPAPFVPTELHFAPAYALVVLGLGGEAAHAALLEPVRAQLSPIVDFVTPIPYTALQQMFNDSAPWGMHAYEKAVYLDELTDGAIDVILEHQPKKMSPMSFVPIFVLGGAYARMDDDATAFGGRRSVQYVVNISGATPTAEGFEAERDWARAYWSALVEHAASTGSYVNFIAEQDEDRVRSSYGAKYERLQRIKAEYDPDNVFHLNANIKPARA